VCETGTGSNAIPGRDRHVRRQCDDLFGGDHHLADRLLAVGEIQLLCHLPGAPATRRTVISREVIPFVVATSESKSVRRRRRSSLLPSGTLKSRDLQPVDMALVELLTTDPVALAAAVIGAVLVTGGGLAIAMSAGVAGIFLLLSGFVAAMVVEYRHAEAG
jgi:hypothetical protein